MAAKTVIQAGHPKLKAKNKEIGNVSLPKIKKLRRESSLIYLLKIYQ